MADHKLDFDGRQRRNGDEAGTAHFTSKPHVIHSVLCGSPEGMPSFYHVNVLAKDKIGRNGALRLLPDPWKKRHLNDLALSGKFDTYKAAFFLRE